MTTKTTIKILIRIRNSGLRIRGSGPERNITLTWCALWNWFRARVTRTAARQKLLVGLHAMFLFLLVLLLKKKNFVDDYSDVKGFPSISDADPHWFQCGCEYSQTQIQQFCQCGSRSGSRYMALMTKNLRKFTAEFFLHFADQKLQFTHP
jgi:hypothetical protein